MKGYRIMNSQGLFSTGSGFPGFTPEGKWWFSTQAVKTHLLTVEKADNLKIYDGCSVVVYEMEPKSSYAVQILIDQIEKSRAERKRRREKGL